MADRGRRSNHEALMYDGRRDHGTVARLLADRAFGFIKMDDGTELFMHRRASFKNPEVFDALVEGRTQVSCQTKQGPKGLFAFDVQVILTCR